MPKYDSNTKAVEFFQPWNWQATSCPGQQCLFDHIEIQKPIRVVATDQMSDNF